MVVICHRHFFLFSMISLASYISFQILFSIVLNTCTLTLLSLDDFFIERGGRNVRTVHTLGTAGRMHLQDTRYKIQRYKIQRYKDTRYKDTRYKDTKLYVNSVW